MYLVKNIESKTKTVYRNRIRRIRKRHSSYLCTKQNSHGVWESFIFTETRLPSQGWKIHLSIKASDALNIFSRIVPFLVNNRISFKIPKYLRDYQLINNGEYGITQIGKIITVYPENLKHLVYIATKLEKLNTLESGPVIVSDIRLSEKSAVYFRYGIIQGNNYYIDENGKKIYYLVNPNNKTEIDHRSVDGKQPDWADVLPFPDIVRKNYYEHNLTELNSNYIPISLIHKSPKGSLSFGFMRETGLLGIQKRTHKLIGEDIYGNDWCTKSQNEFNVLSSIANKVNTPIVYSFEDSRNYTDLYMEFLNGSNLLEIDRSECIKLLPDAATELNRLHREGWVHSDIKLPNFIRYNDKVYLTDFELTEKIGTCRKFNGETPGYVSKKRKTTVSVSRDLYAFGICISNLLLKSENSQLQLNTRKIKQLLRLYGYNEAAKIVNELTDKNADEDTLPKVIKNLHRIEYQSTKTIVATPSLKEWIKSISDTTFSLLEKILISDKGQKYWQSVHSTNDNNIALGVNTGIAGIVIGLSLMNKMVTDKQVCLLNTGLEYLSKSNMVELPRGLFSGKAGIGLALILGGYKTNSRKYIDKGLCILKGLSDISPDRSSDFFNGLSGSMYVMSISYLMTGEKFLQLKAKKIYEEIMARQKNINGKPGWEHDNKALTGAAHGCSGIAVSLILYGKVFKIQEACMAGIHALKSIFQDCEKTAPKHPPHDLTTPSVGAPLSSWCHGLEGILWALLFHEDHIDKFESEINWCVDQLFNEPTIASASSCHGLAGKLELWRMLSKINQHKEKAKDKITEILHVLKITSIKHKGYSTWYSDEGKIISPDLWVGFLGVHTAITAYHNGSMDSILSDSWITKILKN